jgi:membrane associated rhomboid family serine protease
MTVVMAERSTAPPPAPRFVVMLVMMLVVMLVGVLVVAAAVSVSRADAISAARSGGLSGVLAVITVVHGGLRPAGIRPRSHTTRSAQPERTRKQLQFVATSPRHRKDLPRGDVT